MTDTRLPEHFLTSPTLDGLTSDAFRVYVNGLMWSVTHGTDGLIPERALRLLHPDGKRGDLAAELTVVGLWELDDAGYHVPDFLKYQTPAEQVEKARTLARDRKRKQRDRDAADGTDQDDPPTEPSESRVTDSVTDGVTPEDRTETGQAALKRGTYGTFVDAPTAETHKPEPASLRALDSPRPGDMCAEFVGHNARCPVPAAGRHEHGRPFCSGHLEVRVSA